METPKPKIPRAVAKVSPLAGATLDEYLASKVSGWQADAMRSLDATILAAAPTATMSIKWSQPVYEASGPFAYTRGAKAHLTLGFWRGADLDDPTGRLDGDGERMKHVKYTSLEQIDHDQVAGWVRAAVDLNARLGNPAKR